MKLHKGLLFFGISTLLLVACGDIDETDDTNSSDEPEVEEVVEEVEPVRRMKNLKKLSLRKKIYQKKLMRMSQENTQMLYKQL